MNVDPAINVLSLCSGGGGLDLGVRLALPTARTICYVEIEAYACAVLGARMEAGDLDAAPLWTDLTNFDGRPWCSLVDLVIGGYPCQPFSVAGKQRGARDPRNLWPYIRNILCDLGWPDVFFENVANHLRVGFEEVHADLRSMGYRIAAGLFTAEEVGASHKRERLFILAYSGRARRGPHFQVTNSNQEIPTSNVSGTPLGNPSGERRGEGRPPSELRGGRNSPAESSGQTSGIKGLAFGQQSSNGRGDVWFEGASPFPPGPDQFDQWRAILERDPLLAPAIESRLCGMANGLAPRLDRLRILGNGVVPLEAAYAFRTLQDALA